MASYVYGNTARKAVAPAQQRPARAPKKVSRQVQQNRDKALHMSKGYVAFLAIAAVVALFTCVYYLQLQSESTNLSKTITAMQQELSDAKEANTTRYNAIVNSMNLEEIRDKAMKDLGMVYATEDQIIKYKSPTSNAVTQYASIPESGVLASADVVK